MEILRYSSECIYSIATDFCAHFTGIVCRPVRNHQRIVTEHSANIIGRCGFHVLRDFPNRLDISLHADIQFRIRRIQGLYNITEEEATSIVKQSDKDRGLYISTFTGMDWTNSTLFDLSVNTGKIGINKSL